MGSDGGGFCSILGVLLLLLSIVVDAGEGRVIERLNCSPLPQCCRTFVHSPACRGAAAKRNVPAMLPNEDFLRDPRVILLDDDYTVESDLLIPRLTQADNQRLIKSIKPPSEDHSEYFN